MKSFRSLFRPKRPYCEQQSRCFWGRKREEPCEASEVANTDEVYKYPDSWSQPKVVVVGAGIAGLSCAHRLGQRGLCDITILEATDRPGGRIQSCWFTNSVAELGASAIQGASVSNSVYNLAVQEHLIQSPVTHQSINTGIFYTSSGSPVEAEIVRKARADFRHIESLAMSLYSDDLLTDDPNLEIFIKSRIEKQVLNYPESERHGALLVMNNYLTSLKEKTGSSLNTVNAKYYGSQQSLPGGSLKVSVGMGGVLAPLIRDIPECTINYCKPVECVRWEACLADGPRACVQCTEGECYLADYVVITTPLGFLKDKAESFFVPNLSAKKMKAINCLGFGHINNIYMRFSDPLWLEDEGNIMFAWDSDDLAKTGGWVKGLTSLMIDDKSALRAIVAGKEAMDMETLDADQIMQDIQTQIHRFLGSPSIPKPSSILRSKWSTNVYSQGALTYISTESGPGQIRDLADPSPESTEIPVLLFAGEHTSTQNYGTVHGARDSGIREANRILDYTEQLKGAPPKQ